MITYMAKGTTQIRFRVLRGDPPEGDFSVITRVFVRGGKKVEKERIPVTTEAETGVRSFAVGGRGHKPRNVDVSRS